MPNRKCEWCGKEYPFYEDHDSVECRDALKAEVERLRAALEEWKRTDNAPGCTACSVLAAALRGGDEREECGYCGSQLCTGSCQT